MQSQRVLVAGVGMIPFTKPGKSESYEEMGAKAGRSAIADAGISYADIGQVYVGYVYGDSTCGQSAAYEIGLTGVPIVNVNNNCATGSTALFLARQAVEYGITDVALAIGFEQMNPGALTAVFRDRKAAMGRLTVARKAIQGWEKDTPGAAQYFGGAGREHQELYGTKADTFAMISAKARRHALNNPFAVFREQLSVDEILQSPRIYGPLTRYQCCPPTCGAAAVVVVSNKFAKANGISNAVEIIAQAMTTDRTDSFEPQTMINLIGYNMTRTAAEAVYEQAGVGPEDIEVVELHDCFTANELITYEALGLCPRGGAEKYITDGENTYGGRHVTNPSGGLLSKGHPLGATGLAQCYELVTQLRGAANKRQVERARTALQHNLGLGGACVVTLYQAA